MADDLDSELRELQIDYLKDVQETVDVLQKHGRHLAGRNQFKTSFPVLLFLSHQLKGSGGSLGFPRISELANQISLALNQYLEDDTSPRPTPEQLSVSIVGFAEQLAETVTQSQATTRLT
ncbi:MAG TPA: Hpt domain-containing protein [Thermoanaerobaculia bacterium]|nr:Hpt domain-containing protein [Thermoanaerobaculia bacterium]